MSKKIVTFSKTDLILNYEEGGRMHDHRTVFQQFLSVFISPVFPENEEKTRLTRVLYYTSLVTLIASVLLHVTVYIGTGTAVLTIVGSLLRIAAGIAIVILLKRGYYELSSYVFVATIWISFALTTPLNGGVYSIGFRSGFLLLIFVSSLLIGLRAAIFVTLISIAYGLYLALYFPSTEFLKLEYYRHPVRVWLVNAMLFIIAIVFIRFTLNTIRESLEKARKEWKARLKTERSFKASEQSYREVFNATNEAIFVIDPSDGTILDVNETGIRMFGYPSKEEVLARNIGDLSENKDLYTQQHAMELLKKSASGEAQIFEWNSRKKNGELFWTEASLRSSEIQGQTRILAVVRDNTERRKIEVALRESEHRLKLLSDSSFEGIGITLNGVIIETNDQLASMMGCTREEIIGKSVEKFVAPESVNFVRTMIRSGNEEPYEHLALKKDGTEFWVEVRGKQAVIDGRTVRITVMRDIDLPKRQSVKIEQASRQLRNIIRSASRSAFISTNLDGIITAFSPGAELMLGYTVDDVVAVNTPLLFHLESEVKERGAELSARYGYTIEGFDVFVHVAKEGQAEERFWTFVRKDGTHLTVSLAVTPIYDDLGKLQGFLGIAKDITEQKAAEDALKISEQRFSTAFNHAPLLMTISTFDEGRFIEVNDRCFEYSGYHPNEIIGKTALELNWISAEKRQQIIELLETKGHIVDMDLDLNRKDGKLTHRLYNCEIILINGKRHLLSISLNITDRKNAERTISEKEEKYKRLFESAGDAILIMNDEEFIDCNMKSLELFRCSREYLIGRRPYDLSPLVQPGGGSSKEMSLQRIRAALDGNPQTFEWQHLRTDGSVFFAEVSFNKISFAPGMQILAIIRDVSERKRAEEQIRLLAHAVMSTRECICIIDLDEDFLFVNEEFTRTYGYSQQEIVGKNVALIRSKINAVKALTQLRENNYAEAWHGELVHVKKDGSEFPVHVSVSAVRGPDGKPEALIGVISDLTEQKQNDEKTRRLEDQLMHAQKMESFGRLAGGIAHDFNNMLTPILGFGELLKKSFSDSDPRVNKLQQIIHAAESSKNLVSKLLAFARKQNLEMRRIEINGIISEFQKILKRTLRENIDISTQLSEDPSVILGDSGQIEQIILNLAVNAMDAMPHGGSLRIETTRTTSSEVTQLNDYDEPIPQGEYVTLSVSDSGSGIPHDIINKIFDPFFTTKEQGKGTGLGLSTVYGIVKQHRGFISVSSIPGNGTVFRIYIPSYSGDAVPIQTVHRAVSTSPRQKRTLLVVEDQEQILELIQEMLTDEGYTVFTASSVSDALKIFGEKKDSIDALITDIILPDGNGRKLFESLAEVKPGIKVMFMSSYTEDSLSNQNYLPDDAVFIPKPFELSVFIDSVRKLNDA